MVLSSLVAGRIGAVGSVRDGYESGSAIGRGTKWSVGGGGGLAVWGRRALECRGRETSGSLEQRKRPTMREDRRPLRPEPERLTARIGALRSRRSLALSLRRSLWRVERSGIPTLSAPAGGTPASWLPGRLCGFGDEHGPQRSENRAQGGKDTRPGTTQQRTLRKAAGCSHTTDVEGERCQSHTTNGVRGGTSRPRIPPYLPCGPRSGGSGLERSREETTAGAGLES